MHVAMLVYYYHPVQAGGTETQCRKLAHQLASTKVTCTVLTGRHRQDILRNEQDASVNIVRFTIPQIWIDRLLALRMKYQKSRKNKMGAKSITATSGKTNAVGTSIFSIGVWWANILSYILSTSLWLLFHRRGVDVLHVHTGDWIAGYAGWIGACLRIPVVCKTSNLPAFTVMNRGIPFRRVWDHWRKKTHHIAMHDGIRTDLISSGVSSKKIRTIPNGVVIPQNQAAPLARDHRNPE